MADVDAIYSRAWEGLTATYGTPSCPVCTRAAWQYAGTIPTGEAQPPARFCCTTCGYTLIFDGIMLTGQQRPGSPARRPSAA